MQKRLTVLLGCCLALGACATASVDKQSVRATQTAPESTQVEVVRIPYDPALPYYVVTVEPMIFAGEQSMGGTAPAPPGQRHGWGPWGWGLLPTGPKAPVYNPPPQGVSGNIGTAIAHQLTTALTNVGNIRMIDYDYYVQHKANPSALVDKNQREVGPFLIRGAVTELNEIAQASGESTGGSLGGLGAALGIAGAIAGNTAAGIAGGALGLANPTYENTVARRTGSVGMDLRVVTPSNGRLVGSIVANGSFSSESAANGFSLFGFGKASNAYAASALGQANRAAMNSATTQIFERLKNIR